MPQPPVSETDPMVAIDTVLDEIATLKGTIKPNKVSGLLRSFCQAILRTEQVNESLWATDPVNAIFDQNLTPRNKRFIGACLLRLLSSSEPPFVKDEFHSNVFRLFDAVFADDLYRELSLTPKQQTFEKEASLKDLVPRIEADLLGVLQSLTSIEALPNFRQSFMRTFSSPLVKAVVWPFVPRSLLDVRLSELFITANAYVDKSGAEKFRAYRKAVEALDRYREEVMQHPTKYARIFLSSVSNTLVRLLKEDFDRNPLSRPASLLVKPLEKKYPLRERDKDFPLVLSVANDGPGYASNVYLQMSLTDNLLSLRPNLFLGDLEPGVSLNDVEIPCKVVSPEDFALAAIEVIWTNFDGTPGQTTCELNFDAQRSDIDWTALVTEDPYSLQPVITTDQLVGRTEVLNQLMAGVSGKNVASFYVYGQKRVGKTSIVRTLETRLRQSSPQVVLPIYLEGGDYTDPDPGITVARLGKKLCEKLQKANSRLGAISVPHFGSSLAPLSDFLEQVLQFAPEVRVILILDEFDELPAGLYERSPIGDAFFLTIRSISGKEPFGVILVGGEKMELVMSRQGGKLNNFVEVRVDYFDRETHWADFVDLVRRPVAKWLEVAENALTALYQESAGNPYFTKFLCDLMFKMMVDRRDCHVTRKEVTEATRRAVAAAKSPRFQHFWEDGIIEVGQRAEEIMMNRRRVLLAFAEALRRQQSTLQSIKEEAKKVGLSEIIVNADIRDFERRQVIIRQGDDTHHCKVQLFETWLKEKGVNEIINTFQASDALLDRRQEEEKLRIAPDEIIAVVNGWGNYKGRRITEDTVRAWLNQFGDYGNQRLMFQILRSLRFFSDDDIRAKMRVAHGIVGRGLLRRLETGKKKRSDFLVSYLEDSPAKSGSYYAKRYSDENEIYFENIIERGDVSKRLEEKQGFQALVFVDDFVGTGRSASEYFASLAEEHGGLLRTCGISIFFVAISGFQDGKARLEAELDRLQLPVKVHLCDPLDETAKCFNDKSRVFADWTDRERAKDIAYRHGHLLEKKAPLGYGDCQAAVVFESSCPNNSLPILWKEDKEWLPLFRR